MDPFLLLVVYALAAARLTVLVVEDRITKTPRDALVQRIIDRQVRRGMAHARAEYDAAGVTWSDDVAADFRAIYKRKTREQLPYLAYLLTCQWCAGFWLALPAAAAWHWLGDNPWSLVPAAVLAVSYVTGKLAQLGE